MLEKIQLANAVIDSLLASISRNSLDSGVELEMLRARHQWEDSIVLRAITNQFPGLAKFSQDVVTGN